MTELTIQKSGVGMLFMTVAQEQPKRTVIVAETPKTFYQLIESKVIHFSPRMNQVPSIKVGLEDS